MRVEIGFTQSPTGDYAPVPVLEIKHGSDTVSSFRIGWDKPSKIFTATSGCVPGFKPLVIRIIDGKESCASVFNLDAITIHVDGKPLGNFQ